MMIMMIMSMVWNLTSQNRGHQRAYFSSPDDMWAWTAMVMVVVMMPAGEITDSSTRALWQSYQQRYLVASRRNGRRSENFAYSLSEISQIIFNMS
jgi:hypothetical protein